MSSRFGPCDPAREAGDSKSSRGTRRALWPRSRRDAESWLPNGSRSRATCESATTSSLPSPAGEQQLPIVGTFRDFNTGDHSIVMALDRYRRAGTTRGSLGSAFISRTVRRPRLSRARFAPRFRQRCTHPLDGRHPTLVARGLRSHVQGSPRCSRSSRPSLRSSACSSALLAIELERARELSVLRTLGFTPRGLGATLLTQTGLLGARGRPRGHADRHGARAVARARDQSALVRLDAWISSSRPAQLVTGMALAVGAALLAGIYPSLAREPASSSAARCGRNDDHPRVRAHGPRGFGCVRTSAREPRGARRACLGCERRSDRDLRFLGEGDSAGFARATGAARVLVSRGSRESRRISHRVVVLHGQPRRRRGPHFGFELTFFRYRAAPAKPVRRDSSWGAESGLDGALRADGRCSGGVSSPRERLTREAARARGRRRRAVSRLGQGLVRGGRRRRARRGSDSCGTGRRDVARVAV